MGQVTASGWYGRVSTLALVALSVTWLGHEAQAADTVETFDVGATDLELYMGLDGLGRPARAGAAAFAAEAVAGYGLFDGISLSLGGTLQGQESLDQAIGGFYLLLVSTPLDTTHIDLDLMLAAGACGSSLSELELAPGIELNFDARPDMSSWGLYARLTVPLYGAAEEEEGAKQELAVRFDTVVGAYLTLAAEHQVLLEIDAAHLLRDPTGRRSEIGGLAFGYNRIINGTFELINQLRLDIPQQEAEAVAFGFTSGVIATLP